MLQNRLTHILEHIMFTQEISDTHTHSFEVISPMSHYSSQFKGICGKVNTPHCLLWNLFSELLVELCTCAELNDAFVKTSKTVNTVPVC